MGDDVPKKLPYRAEYAKTARGGCKGCKGLIDKDELKLAFMVQSRFHDGMDALFFHFECFFLKHKPKTVGDIAHFDELRISDQERLKKKVGAPPTAAKTVKDSLQDFVIAYAKSAASTCKACDEKIPKNEVRVSKKDYESPNLMFTGGAGVDAWHHFDCFVKVREALEFFHGGDKLPGFKDLDREDQADVKKKLPPITAKVKEAVAAAAATAASSKRKLEETSKNGESSKKKRAKKDDSAEHVSGKKSEETERKKQNDEMFKYRDAFDKALESKKEGLKKADLHQILSTNKQEIPTGIPKALERISDIMTFGALKPCPRCNGQFVFRSGVGYQCLGYATEFTKCMNIVEKPERVPFKIPHDLRENKVFKSYKFTPKDRLLQKLVTSASTASTKSVKLVRRPLKGFDFFLSSSDKNQVEKWSNKIKEFGGKVNSKKSSKVTAVITTQGEIDTNASSVQFAEKKGLPVLTGKFIDALTEVNFNLSSEIVKHAVINPVPNMVTYLRSKNGDYEEKALGEKKDGFEKEMATVKMKVKDGSVVDPESDLEDVGHVLKDGGRGGGFFSCVLNRSSIEDGRNSYYKQQIIEADTGSRYWVFQAWGRIGTVIGGHKTHDNISKHEAIDIFTDKFYELTGNMWGEKFHSKPGLYTKLDLDYGEQKHIQTLVPSTKESKLPMPVQQLIALIFDINRMKKAMMEFEINLEEMPLGKISKKQVMDAYRILSEASDAVGGRSDDSRLAIRDLTNRFYTLIPHNFGSRMPPPLDNDAIVKTKIDMLESLLEIELAYQLLLEGDKSGDGGIDSHYSSLQARIDPLESGSEEYGLLTKYLMNTHADTHKTYTLDVEHIFKVNRSGEKEKYKEFDKLHNKKLLWHGSRITNYAGILSQGLRIAPPEAPVTGYMFGKGVYFADMVSKSANYCHASRDSTSGLLLLCEVALGDMHELKRADDTLTKAPKKCHSVKGCGQTEPDPEEVVTLPDGIQIPLGKPKPAKGNKNSDLLYNEYIVYNTAQINIRYLMKVNFNFTGRRS